MLEQRAFKHLALDAREILHDELGVGWTKSEACFKELVERVRLALIDETRQTIDPEAVREIARAFGGGTGDGPNGFVAPSCWPALRAQLERDHAIILVGEPGTGKSAAAEQLVRMYRKVRPPFEAATFSNRDDPRALLSYWRGGTGRSRRIAWVDDPFGSDQLTDIDERTAWARALEQVAPIEDFVLVVTSRSTFMTEVERHLPKLGSRVFAYDGAFFDQASGLNLLAAKVAGESNLTADERAEILLGAHEIVTRLTRAISIELFPSLYARSRGAGTTRERRQRAIEVADGARLGEDFHAFFASQGDPVRRGSYAAAWLLDLDTSAESLSDLLGAAQGDLDSSAVDVDLDRAVQLMRERRWLRVRPGAARERLHSTHYEKVRALARDDRMTAAAIARTVIQGRWDGKQHLVAARLAHILADHSYLAIHAVVEPMRAAARKAIVARPPKKGFSRALSFLAITGRADHPLDLAAMALGDRVSRRDGEWWYSGRIESWRRPSWDGPMLELVLSEPTVSALAENCVQEMVVGLPLLFFGQHELVDFLYEIANVGAAFRALAPQLDSLGYSAEAVAYGIAKSGADSDALVLQAAAIEASLPTEPDEPYDEDSVIGMEHLSEQYCEQLAPAEYLADAVIRTAPPEFLLGRKEPLLFERFAKLLAEVAADDPRIAPTFIRRVIGCCPPRALPSMVTALIQRDETVELALEALKVLPTSEWASVRFFKHLDNDDQSSGSRLAGWLVESYLPSVRPPEKARALAQLRGSIPVSALEEARSHLTGAERALFAVLSGETSASSDPEVLALMREIAEGDDAHAAGVLAALIAAGDDVRSRIRSFASNRDPAVAQSALAAARQLPPAERGEFVIVGLAHRRAAVRIQAAEIGAGLTELEVRSAIAKLVENDRTASVRVAAIRSMAAIPDEFALDVLERALTDPTDTSDAARHGHMLAADEEDSAEYGVANEARAQLESSDCWPLSLRARVVSLTAGRGAPNAE